MNTFRTQREETLYEAVRKKRWITVVLNIICPFFAYLYVRRGWFGFGMFCLIAFLSLVSAGFLYPIMFIITLIHTWHLTNSYNDDLKKGLDSNQDKKEGKAWQ